MSTPLFQARRSIVENEWTKENNCAKQVCWSELQRFVPTEITIMSRNFKGYRPSGSGSRSIPVDRQWDETLWVVEISKIHWQAKLTTFG